jgi:hypothetical protein
MAQDARGYNVRGLLRPGRKRHGGACPRQGVTFQLAGVDDKSLTDSFCFKSPGGGRTTLTELGKLG